MVAVSVLTTSYNAGRFLLESVNSVLGQTFTDFELIIVDNGSNDGSISQIMVNDSRIRLISFPENIGRTPALVHALSLAQGEFVAILDADDVALPERLHVQLEFLWVHLEVGLVGSIVDLVDADNQELQSPQMFSGWVDHDALAERNVFVNSSVMFRRTLALEAGGYDIEYEYAQDYDLFVRIAAVSQSVVLDRPLTRLRIYDQSYTNAPQMKLVRARDEHRLFQLMPNRLQLSPRGHRLNKRRLAIATMYLGLIEIVSGKIVRGAGRILRGAIIDRRLSWVPYVTKNLVDSVINRFGRSSPVSPSTPRKRVGEHKFRGSRP